MKLNKISTLWNNLDDEIVNTENTTSYKIFLLVYMIILIYLVYKSNYPITMKTIRQALFAWVVLRLPTLYFSINENYNNKE